jgi:putative membrane protein
MAFLPTISTLFILISAILVAIGWRLIAKDKKAAHKKTMLAAAVSALLFFIIYVSRTIFVGNTSFGGPEELEIYYTVFLIFHIILATTGAVFGLVTLRLALKRKISTHRKIGPVTSVIWFFTALTGIMVYLFLYVLYDGGETTSLIRAILGT